MKKSILTIIGLVMATGVIFAQNVLTKHDSASIQIVATQTITNVVTMRQLLMQQRMLQAQLAATQARLNAVNNQIAQANALGVSTDTVKRTNAVK
jgi:hypothetical protein